MHTPIIPLSENILRGGRVLRRCLSALMSSRLAMNCGLRPERRAIHGQAQLTQGPFQPLDRAQYSAMRVISCMEVLEAGLPAAVAQCWSTICVFSSRTIPPILVSAIPAIPQQAINIKPKWTFPMAREFLHSFAVITACLTMIMGKAYAGARQLPNTFYFYSPAYQSILLLENSVHSGRVPIHYISAQTHTKHAKFYGHKLNRT